jgi:ectoine hydroxylase-related dioxygenase (phytanoyl-CoA dioxygenase family)
MNCELSPEQIDFYGGNGYLVHENLLTPDELNHWRQVVDEAVRRRDRRHLPTRSFNNENEYYSNIFIQCVNLWQDNPQVRQLALSEQLGQMAVQLEDVDTMRLWQDHALYKEPHANATSWHLDNPYFSFYSRQSISIWIALDDTTMQNGCLYFLPGTHRTATFDNIDINENMNDLFRVYPQWSEIEPVSAPIKAGSCTFHNGLTAHAAGPNMTTHTRRGISIVYMPQGEVFNGQQSVLTTEQFESYIVGQPLNDEQQVPTVFSR